LVSTEFGGICSLQRFAGAGQADKLAHNDTLISLQSTSIRVAKLKLGYNTTCVSIAIAGINCTSKQNIFAFLHIILD
jgi:hypothetical protein